MLHRDLLIPRGPVPSGTEKFKMQRQITELCQILNKYVPQQFVDLSQVGNISSQFLGSTGGIGLTKFEWQILLGCELVIRLLKEPRTTSYRGRIGDKVSANLIISDMWMKNV